ncbi:Transglycosylase-like [uncultured Caudovirales phage]|uniref:Transglycosylase-like n=1 Tax=uncultured Caudovirales phage TaxID=2100421 RepID=A0A6J5MEM6_9CAUD|nr:Transglycosylase-like [uncultured Caudovirales phage]CAB4169448.1 Transglycosylase-like [uncultured Caudovirales phage]CAB4195766.1 Transglycosylase-like [uncultured Caudovirales phage]
MQKHLALVAFSIISTIHFTPSKAVALSTTTVASINTAASELQEQFPKIYIPSMHPELRAQIASKKAAKVRFWEAVSWCETHHDWQNGGYYAGGLGIAQSAWRGYGGWEFAKSPKNATKEEQIVVANRISFLGYQTKNTFMTFDDRLNNRPFFRPSTRTPSWGRNCVNWKTRRPLSERYVETPLKG